MDDNITVKNFVTPEGFHDGGVAYGQGFTICWQRGPTKENGRNGAFLIEVLKACEAQLAHYQDGRFACQENALALEKLCEAIASLEARRDRRIEAGTHGTTQVD